MSDRKNNPAFGGEWEEIQKELLTDEEREECRIRAEILCAFVEARKNKKISQRDLEKLSGIKQPMIARIEKEDADPRLGTIIKYLRPLGMTLAIVPAEK